VKKNKDVESVIVRLADNPGDGIPLMGSQFAVSTALSGVDFTTSPNYRAEFRATVGCEYAFNAHHPLRMVADRRANFQQIEVGFLGENAAETWEKSILDPSSLSFAELRTMDAYLTIQLSRMLSIFQLEQDGLLEAGTTEHQMQINFPYYFGNDFAKSYWVTQESLWPADFTQLVNSVIDRVVPNFTRSLFERMYQPTSTDEVAETGR